MCKLPEKFALHTRKSLCDREDLSGGCSLHRGRHTIRKAAGNTERELPRFPYKEPRAWDSGSWVGLWT